MGAVIETNERLRETDGFLVESPEGDVGWVEEIWVDEANAPRAIAVQTIDGKHALLLGEEVVAVDREQRWVVVRSRPALLELDRPCLATGGDRAASGRRVAASWAATGALLAPSAQPSRRSRLRVPRPRQLAVRDEDVERPLWQIVAVLYASLALVVALVMTLAFLVARLVGGAAS